MTPPSFTAYHLANALAEPTGLPRSRVYGACLAVAAQHGRPRIGRVAYRLSPVEIAECTLASCAWGAHLTDNLGEWLEAMRRSGIVEPLAHVIEAIWERSGGVIAGDSIVLDGAGRFAWERVAEDETHHLGGSPAGKAFVLTWQTIALAAQAGRVAAALTSGVNRRVTD